MNRRRQHLGLIDEASALLCRSDQTRMWWTHGVEYLEGPLAHQLVWQVLDQAHEMLARERLDEAYTAWDWARRRHGQRMHEWIVYLKKPRLERDAQDPVVVSTDQMANEVLPREVPLCAPQKKTQVQFNSGGALDLHRIETVLRIMFPIPHEVRRRTVRAVPSINRSPRPQHEESVPDEGVSQTVPFEDY